MIVPDELSIWLLFKKFTLLKQFSLVFVVRLVWEIGLLILWGFLLVSLVILVIGLQVPSIYFTVAAFKILFD